MTLTLEPWQVQRATWNDLNGRRMIADLPLRSLEEIRAEWQATCDAGGAIRKEFCQHDPRTGRETWSDTYKKAEWAELFDRATELREEEFTTREILMGRWALAYDPAGRELVTKRGGDPDAFRAAMVAVAEQHEAAVRQAIAEGKPVPLYVRRDYA